MTKEEYLRLLFILDSSRATTFNTNLVKLVEAVLADKENKGQTLGEITSEIKEVFSLDFDIDEIKTAIRKRGKEFIIDPGYYSDAKYRLKPDRYSKIRHRIENKNIDEIFSAYIHDNHLEKSLGVSECREIIIEYLYHVFNDDVAALQALINGTGKLYTIKENLFTEKKTEVINSFLNWNNKQKDDFVFAAITCGIDYCILTNKKDNKLTNVFRGKTFYLDANIIFRLMGINDEYRKTSTLTFINRCKSTGIKIKYTNFTRGEVTATIETHIKTVKELLGNNAPLRTEYIRKIDPKYNNIDFLEAYERWVCEEGKVGDYRGFKQHLGYLAEKIFQTMNQETHNSYEEHKTIKRFNDLKTSLSACKASRSKNASDATLGVDVSNYMLLEEKYSSNSGRSNISDTNYYIITADHAYIDWARKLTPNAIPIVVLPSVWYSILLKYQGRSDDDNKSFAQFLNLRITYEHRDRKDIDCLISKVSNLPENEEIKNRVLYDISQNIQEYTDKEYDTDKMIAVAQQSVIEEMVNGEVEKKMKDLEIQQRILDNTSEIAQREAVIKYKNELREKIVKNANKEIRSTWLIRKAIAILLSLIILAASVYGAYQVYIHYGIELTVAVISAVGGLGYSMFLDRIFKKLWKWSKKDILIDRYVLKELKKYDIDG